MSVFVKKYHYGSQKKEAQSRPPARTIRDLKTRDGGEHSRPLGRAINMYPINAFKPSIESPPAKSTGQRTGSRWPVDLLHKAFSEHPRPPITGQWPNIPSSWPVERHFRPELLNRLGIEEKRHGCKYNFKPLLTTHLDYIHIFYT